MKSAKRNIGLVVCHGFSRRRSGYMVRVQRMVATMQKAGLDPHVLWFVPAKQILTDRRLSAPHLSDVRVTWVPTVPGFRAQRLTAIAEDLHAWLVAGVSRWLQPAFIQAENTDAMRLCSRVSFPVIFDLHGDTIAEVNPQLLLEAELDATNLAVSERLLLGRTSHLICNSRNLESVLQRRHGPLPASTVVSCAADMGPFFSASSQRETERKNRGLANRLVLCYLGGLSAWQCIIQTIELVARLKQKLPKIYFLLLTPDDPRPYGGLLSQLGRAGNDYAVCSLNAAEVPAVLSAVDVGLLLRANTPINHVSSPTKCGEYLAAGAPVICTQHSGDAASILAVTGAGVVLENETPTDEEVHALIPFLCSVSAQREGWHQKAVEAARRHCDWAVYEKALACLYRCYFSPESTGDENKTCSQIVDSPKSSAE